MGGYTPPSFRKDHMIRFKNNTGGYFSIRLEDITGMKPSKFFSFPMPSSELTIPSDYVATIPLNEYAYNAYQKGLFVITHGQDEFDKLMKESGMFEDKQYEEDKANIAPDTMLLAALRDGKLDKVMAYYNSPNKDRLMQIAADHINEISQEKINALEKASGISIAMSKDE